MSRSDWPRSALHTGSCTAETALIIIVPFAAKFLSVTSVTCPAGKTELVDEHAHRVLRYLREISTSPTYVLVPEYASVQGNSLCITTRVHKKASYSVPQ